MSRYTAFYIALTVGVRYEMHTDLRYRWPIGTPFFLYVYEHAMAEVNKVVAFEGHNYTFTTEYVPLPAGGEGSDYNNGSMMPAKYTFNVSDLSRSNALSRAITGLITLSLFVICCYL